MERIQDWNGRWIEAGRSRGGVLVVRDWADNLVRGGANPWPPPELTQKLCRADRASFFDPDEFEKLASPLGYYSDLQSVHSEDALTWSVFGPLIYSAPEVRHRFVETLLQRLEINYGRIRASTIWLWRRLPHPDNFCANGPEIDFGIQAEDVLLLGEAKWRSEVGAGQGQDGKKDQLEVRRLFLREMAPRLFPDSRQLVLLAVSPSKPLQAEVEEFIDNDRKLIQRFRTWAGLCAITSHPGMEELGRYLRWKQDLSQSLVPPASVR